MAKDLKTSVILETKTAEDKLKALVKAINKVDDAINKVGSTTDKLSQGLQQSISHTKKLQSVQQEVTKEVKKTNSAHKKTSSLLDGIGTKLKRLAGTYLGIMGMSAIIGASDTITKSENKLNQINGGNTKATQAQMDAMYSASQRSRMGYGDMMANVSKSMTLSPDAFGGDMNAAIAFQEVMAKSYALGGASQAEQSSSMYQMIQALGSGKLAGDELRSVTEGAPLAAKQIEKFAQEIYKTDLALKDMGASGMLTSEIVVAAMLSAGDEIDKKFEDTAMTFEQAWTKIKNTALKSFEPVLQKLNDLLNSDVGKAVLSGIGTAIQIIANVLTWVFTKVEQIYNFIADNWGVISKVLLSIATIIGAFLIPKFIAWIGYLGFVVAYYAVLAAQAVASGVAAFMAWAMANLPLFLLIAIIALVILAVIWMSDSFTDACGNIVGAVFWLGATIWNIIVGVINGIIQFLWTRFVEPWIGIIEWVLNVFNGGFNSFGDAVKNLLGNIISWFLSLGKVVTKIIDAIFGTDWTSGLNNLQDKVLSWGKNENAITLSREAPEVLQRVSAQDAFNTGYGYGEQFGNWATDKVSTIGNKLKGTELPSATLDDIAGYDAKTAKNTDKMADSMELAAEDLELLYNLAEMEWKKEFTTANITVDMSNYNTFNGTNDYEGFALYVRDVIAEEASAVANGAYSFG